MYEKKLLPEVRKCVFCGSDAILDHYGSNLYYVYCSNENCFKVDRFSCLGSSAQNAIDQWDALMRPINRMPPKRKKKDESGNI